MAIHPGYANAILDGRKKVEFRKRALAPDVHTVLVYATSPVQRVVGEFTVDGTTVTSPADLWKRVGHTGCIERREYDSYYAGSARAAGIHIAHPRRYDTPLRLTDLAPPQAVPQSFAYLPPGTLERARDQQPRRDGSGRAVWESLASRIRQLRIW